MKQKFTELSPLWKENLTRMLGASSHIPKAQHGYKNHFCASVIRQDLDFVCMLELEEAGLVRSLPERDGLQFFRATEAGCRAIGLSEEAVERAMEG